MDTWDHLIVAAAVGISALIAGRSGFSAVTIYLEGRTPLERRVFALLFPASALMGSLIGSEEVTDKVAGALLPGGNPEFVVAVSVIAALLLRRSPILFRRPATSAAWLGALIFSGVAFPSTVDRRITLLILAWVVMAATAHMGGRACRKVIARRIELALACVRRRGLLRIGVWLCLVSAACFYCAVVGANVTGFVAGPWIASGLATPVQASAVTGALLFVGAVYEWSRKREGKAALQATSLSLADYVTIFAFSGGIVLACNRIGIPILPTALTHLIALGSVQAKQRSLAWARSHRSESLWSSGSPSTAAAASRGVSIS